DVAIAIPQLMSKVSRLGRVLGPQGKMPSPKAGTVTADFVQAVKEYGVGEEKIRYFPNTAEALYRPIGTPTLVLEGDKLPGSFRIMFAGNIGAAQDFTTILDAAERLRNIPEIHWVILGDGRLRPWVAEQVEKRGLQSTVHLLGRHPKEKMPDFFAQADALLVTLKKEEIFALTIPSKVQAYLACGRPVIAALEGEGQRVIEEAGAGLVVEPENPEKLAEAVQTMYNIPKSDRREMGARGRDYFNDHFDRTKLFEKLEGWMQEICSMDVSKEKQQ
ncbi:MAG: glycosyltransferase, partial [Desulfobulbaceae bacterium]|nr:glycosyltransferase [Desulfobulbaceae bacterium]